MLEDIIEQVRKFKEYDHYKESNEVHTGTVGQRMEAPLRERLANNNIEADAQRHLDKLARNEAPDVDEDQLDDMIDRFVEQIAAKVFK